MDDLISKKDEVEKIFESLEFETELYRELAQGEFKIVAFPHPDGYYLKQEDIDFYVAEAKLKKYKLLYRLQCDNYYIVYDREDVTRIGLLPRDPNGFQC